MRVFIFLALWAIFLPRSTAATDPIDSLLQGVLVHEGKHPVHNVLFYARNGQTDFQVARGYGIRGRDEMPVTSDFRFKVASITKTFVSVVTQQLIEEGRLHYDDHAADYLTGLDFLRFEEFHILEGEAYAKNITVEQLLRHTSGIGDIFSDKETRFFLSVILNKQKQYDEERIVRKYFKYRLHKNPHNVPGEGYHYSDMNYMLLGFIIEQVTGQSLPHNIRTRILEPLDMTHTYFEYYEPTAEGAPQIDTYFNRLNLTRKVNTSYEWAGGGLVSTPAEIGRFIEALFAGKLFQDSATLQRMIDLEPSRRVGKAAGMGIFQYELADNIFYGHGGFYGSLMLYSPEEDLTLVIHLGQSNPDLDERALLEGLVGLVRDIR